MNKDIIPLPPPRCPGCGAVCIKETKVLKASGTTVEVWVCSEKKKPSCLD
jgi:hypothetical protein